MPRRLRFCSLHYRLGARISSDKLRRCARCTACGHNGATSYPGWAGEHIGFMPFPLSRYDAASPIEPLPRDHARHPCFAATISRRRIKPASAVEVVAVVFN
jgi:hypothetical protein